MKLEMTGRHVVVTPALKSFTREKLERILKHVDDPLEVHAILTVEKHRHIAEIVARGSRQTLSARMVTADMYTSIAEAADKIERQARKHKERAEARRRRSTPAPGALAAPPEPPARRRRTAAAAPRRARTARTGNGIPPIVKSDDFPRKPMSVEEAALQVHGSDLGFFVFRNERSQEINVLYRRKDGSLGLIEPET